MLDQKLAEGMQRVLSVEIERFTLTATLARLVKDFGIGRTQGKSVYFTSKDRSEIRDLLRAKGYSVEQEDLSGLSRSERLAVTPNEKAGGEAIKRNRVSIKALGGQSLVLGGVPLKLPEESHLDVDWTRIAAGGDCQSHRCVLIVENYENFNRVHETSFVLPEVYESPLVLYRGDPNESRLDSVKQFLATLDLPVVAFMDIDPAGIAMASQFPNLVGMITPELRALDAQLGSPSTGRRDLFQTQFPVWKSVLENLQAENPCKAIWDLVARHRSGVVQERWVSGEALVLTNTNQN